MAEYNNSNFELNTDNRNMHNHANNNTSIEEILSITDNFGNRILIYRREYENIAALKNVICRKMELLYSVVYRPDNLRLFRLDNHEIVEYMDAEGIFDIRIVVVPVVCDGHNHSN